MRVKNSCTKFKRSSSVVYFDAGYTKILKKTRAAVKLRYFLTLKKMSSVTNMKSFDTTNAVQVKHRTSIRIQKYGDCGPKMIMQDI